jgi:DNA repair protein SbcD/Mre11
VRLVHTSDWHVGVTLGMVDRRADLEVAADALVSLVERVRPDLVVHTGDLFDRSLPAGDDVRFAADTLGRLAAIAPVLVLCGNHDGRATFAGFDRFCAIGQRRLRLLPQIDVHDPVLTWPTADGGRLRVAAVPYLPLAAAGFRSVAEGTIAEGAYADRVRQVWAIAGAALDRDRRPGDVDIAAAHLHVTGASLARSEKQVHVGDDAATDPAALPAVSYAAFGHIHKPQRLPGTLTGRYAGSMIPIDFGEEGEAKGAVVVDAEPGRAARVEFVALGAGRPLVTVTGALVELGQLLVPHRDAIVRVRVTDAERIEHLAERVREHLSQGAVLYQAVQPSLRLGGYTSRPVADADIVTLLRRFAAARGVSDADGEALVALWQAALDGDDTDLSGGVVAALEAALGAVPAVRGQQSGAPAAAQPVRSRPRSS